MPIIPLDEIVFILLLGFSLGVIAYNIILFWCTHQAIYLLFSITLFGYALVVGDMRVLAVLLPSSFWPFEKMKFLIEACDFVLFIAFVKHFLMVSVDFKSAHPNLTRLINLYIAIGILLVTVSVLFPDLSLFAIKDMVAISACLFAIVTLPFYYPTIKDLRGFLVAVLSFCLILILFYIYRTFSKQNFQLEFSNNVQFLFCILIFISFSSLITSRLNHDREQREIAQQSSIKHLTKYQQLYENALEGLFTSQLDGSLVATNPTLDALLGIDLSLPNKASKLLHSFFAEKHAAWEQITHTLKQSDKIQALELQGLKASWYNLSARLVHTTEGSVIEGSLVDITEQKQQALELAYLAEHDSLTGLFNRDKFEQCLQGALISLDQQALLFIDLDQFKVINDTCGHPAGDECLRQIARILQAQLVAGETLARLGGDEFGLLLSYTSEKNMLTRADSIRQVIENSKFIWQDRLFKTTLSIGLIDVSSAINSVAQALSLSDAACYAAKEAGRNCVMLGDPLSDVTQLRHNQMNMVATLYQAIETNQLVLYQQQIIPIQQADKTSLPKYEILVRLRTGNKILLPGAFLPAAQRYDLMPQIDRWVFKTACAWLESHHNQLVSQLNINLSPQTLSHPGFIEFVLDTIRDYAIDPSLFCFEITEYSAIRDLGGSIRHLQQLRDLGMLFALDDFGSGFASFDYVKSLPVDFIKIDGQFVRNIMTNDNDRTMVQAVTKIAHNLGKKVVAEFVENQETVELLSLLGVDFAQGYYFGTPREILFDDVELRV